MTITAKVHDHVITLPPEVRVEDGTEVQITVPDHRVRPAVARKIQPEWLRRSLGTATTDLSTDAIMQMTRGEA